MTSPRAESVDPHAVVAVTPRQRFLRRFRNQRPAVAALAFLVFITAVAAFGPLIAPHDPAAIDLANTLEPPFEDASHPLGTDDLGRDVLSRLIDGTRLSLIAAVTAVGIALVIGVPLGLVSGYLGGMWDTVIMRITDAVMSFPALLLAVAIVGVLGPSLTNAMLAIGVVFAPRFVRLVRATVLSLRKETFIEAARSVGAPTHLILRRHVLPNIMGPLLVQVSLGAGVAMLAEAGLSFLGLGVQPPDASWGVMLARAFPVIGQSPWQIWFPGLAIMLSVLAFNVLGDGLRDSLGREIRDGA